VNPAVPWSSYWTPLKFLHIVNLANLFDESTLKKAWNARITINSARAEAALVEVCQTILERVSGLQDKRSQEILADGLKWAIANPARINYNVNSKDDSLQISPNLVGFQLVMHGIAARLKKSKAQANKIIVDRQTEFNLAQEYIADFYKKYKDVPFLNGPGLPTMDLTHMPTTPITCTPGTESVGLELVDIYIWVFKRHYEEKALAPELRSIINAQLYSGRYDEVSIKALINRWGKWFRELPEPSEEQLAEARIRKAFEEKRRKSNL